MAELATDYVARADGVRERDIGCFEQGCFEPHNEQNIGALTPLIADELLDAERNFPANWLKEAVRTAVENNARSWRYVLAILERWKREGKDDHGKGRADTEKTRRRYLDYLES